MGLPAGSIGFGFVAGVLSILSPCVLPLLPLVLGPATAAHPLGLPALTARLVACFVGIGLFVATIGFSIGLDGEVFRDASAVLLALLGAVLLSEALQQRFAAATGGVSNLGNRLIARIAPEGLGGQFCSACFLGRCGGRAWGQPLGRPRSWLPKGGTSPASRR